MATGKGRIALYWQLGVAVIAATGLSLDALRQLALVSGFVLALAPLLPATGSSCVARPPGAQRFGR